MVDLRTQLADVLSLSESCWAEIIRRRDSIPANSYGYSSFYNENYNYNRNSEDGRNYESGYTEDDSLIQNIAKTRAKLVDAIGDANEMTETHMECLAHILALKTERTRAEESYQSTVKSLQGRVESLLEVLQSQQEQIDKAHKIETLSGIWKKFFRFSISEDKVSDAAAIDRMHTSDELELDSYEKGMGLDLDKNLGMVLTLLSAQCAHEVSQDYRLTLSKMVPGGAASARPNQSNFVFLRLLNKVNDLYDKLVIFAEDNSVVRQENLRLRNKLTEKTVQVQLVHRQLESSYEQCERSLFQVEDKAGEVSRIEKELQRKERMIQQLLKHCATEKQKADLITEEIRSLSTMLEEERKLSVQFKTLYENEVTLSKAPKAAVRMTTASTETDSMATKTVATSIEQALLAYTARAESPIKFVQQEIHSTPANKMIKEEFYPIDNLPSSEKKRDALESPAMEVEEMDRSEKRYLHILQEGGSKIGDYDTATEEEKFIEIGRKAVLEGMRARENEVLESHAEQLLTETVPEKYGVRLDDDDVDGNLKSYEEVIGISSFEPDVYEPKLRGNSHSSQATKEGRQSDREVLQNSLECHVGETLSPFVSHNSSTIWSKEQEIKRLLSPNYVVDSSNRIKRTILPLPGPVLHEINNGRHSPPAVLIRSNDKIASINTDNSNFGNVNDTSYRHDEAIHGRDKVMLNRLRQAVQTQQLSANRERMPLTPSSDRTEFPLHGTSSSTLESLVPQSQGNNSRNRYQDSNHLSNSMSTIERLSPISKVETASSPYSNKAANDIIDALSMINSDKFRKESENHDQYDGIIHGFADFQYKYQNSHPLEEKAMHHHVDSTNDRNDKYFYNKYSEVNDVATPDFSTVKIFGQEITSSAKHLGDRNSYDTQKYAPVHSTRSPTVSPTTGEDSPAYTQDGMTVDKLNVINTLISKTKSRVDAIVSYGKAYHEANLSSRYIDKTSTRQGNQMSQKQDNGDISSNVRQNVAANNSYAPSSIIKKERMQGLRLARIDRNHKVVMFNNEVQTFGQ